MDNRGTGRPRPNPPRPAGRSRPVAHVTVEKRSHGKVTDELVSGAEPQVEDVTPGTRQGRIRIGGGVTRNMGNFESVRVDVQVEWPCAPTVEGTMQVYEDLSQLVENIIQEEIRLATSGG